MWHHLWDTQLELVAPQNTDSMGYGSAMQIKIEGISMMESLVTDIESET